MWTAMNSLNIVSRLTSTPPPTPPRSRTSSSANIKGEYSDDASPETSAFDPGALSEKLALKRDDDDDGTMVKEEESSLDENTPLLSNGEGQGFKDAPGSRVWALPRRVSHAILGGVSVVFATITAPVRYVIACFYDEQGHFSAIMPLRNFKHLLGRRQRKRVKHGVPAMSEVAESEQKSQYPRRVSSRRSPSVDSNASSSSAVTSDGEDEKPEGSPARHTRSKTGAVQSGDEPALQNRRIKIKVHNEDVRKRRAEKAKKQNSASPEHVTAVANSLKSPSSPSSNSRMTRYPRAPVPPRPLVPRRQPSFSLSYSPVTSKKTLIIDLDETLIHSMAKGGRMSTGHMVEVRLGGPVQAPAPTSAGAGQQPPVALGPGVPILYYVHERPNCHEFLRKVSKWYNLVVFTASVQEYADPVIDWLERERRYFSGRYYRQHCTFRNGAYIKDLAQVEPDLSRVMILDNSPMSYLFHDDNAIPIEGWISDPTDTDLLHLIPLLEALQYVTDVRALLALRKGQAQQA